MCKEEKCEENWAIFKNKYISREMPKQFPSILICEVVYINYINLVEIGLVVLETWKTEFSDFTVPVNNTLVCHASFVFLATDTLLCVLIYVRTLEDFPLNYALIIKNLSNKL